MFLSKVEVPLNLPGIEAARKRRGQETSRAISLAFQGTRLEKGLVEEYEKQLLDRPDELTSRIQLLGYYFVRQFSFPEEKARRSKHILWIIEHQPRTAIAFTPYIRLETDPPAYAHAKGLWLHHLEQAHDVALIENAALFLSKNDRSLAQSIWRQIH